MVDCYAFSGGEDGLNFFSALQALVSREVIFHVGNDYFNSKTKIRLFPKENRRIENPLK
jgi:hypothetical protein